MAIAVYKNGNAYVTLDLNDGTREIFSRDDEFNFDFPLSMDLNIGNRCDGGCQYCYINASPNGIDAELDLPFIDSLMPYTEAAINGNSLDHAMLIPFLEKLKKKHVVSNITVNQIHFERKEDILRDLVDRGLVKGIGISLRKPTPEFIERVKKYPNAIIHTINGILSPSDIEALRDNDLKILILGYKNLGRGVDYKTENELLVSARQRYLYDILETLPSHFKVVSFDCLALEQLNVKRILTQEQWDEMYQGRDGEGSMYVDLVSGKFGISSLASPDEMWPIMDDVRDMFRVVKEKAKLSKVCQSYLPPFKRLSEFVKTDGCSCFWMEKELSGVQFRDSRSLMSAEESRVRSDQRPRRQETVFFNERSQRQR